VKAPVLYVLAACCLIAGAACGGGSSGTKAADSSKIPTATLPATLPAPQIISGAAAQPGGQASYTIKDGDTLAGIADKFGISLDDLRAANPGIDPLSLRTGQTIKLPSAASTVPATEAPAPVATDTPAPAEPTEPSATDTPGPTNTPSSLGSTYTVQSGDIPETIAAKFGITVDELLAANPGIDPNNLQVGQVLIIPPTATPAA
jgi:LysM repeat protein